jgi:hypothetical protein
LAVRCLALNSLAALHSDSIEGVSRAYSIRRYV